MPTSVTSGRAPSRRASGSGVRLARAVDAQQREIGRLVLGDAIGMAEAGDDRRPGSRRSAWRSVTMCPAVLTTMPVPYSTLRPGGGPIGARSAVGNGE